MAFGFYGIYALLGLAAGRYLGWGASFALTELRATAAYAFWYPFSDALEYIPGYDDDGVAGALITTATAIGLTVTIGFAAMALDGAMQPTPPTLPTLSPPVATASAKADDALGALPGDPSAVGHRTDGYGVRMYGANINTMHAATSSGNSNWCVGGSLSDGATAGVGGRHLGDGFATVSHLGDGLSMMHLDPGR